MRPARSIGSVKLKSLRVSQQDEPQHALFLEEVAFTAYYPADVDETSKKGIPWFLRYATSSIASLSSAVDGATIGLSENRYTVSLLFWVPPLTSVFCVACEVDESSINRRAQLASLAHRLFLWSPSPGTPLQKKKKKAVHKACLKIPAYQNASLLSPPVTKETLKRDDLTLLSQWPLVIFSHGLGGNRTAYRSAIHMFLPYSLILKYNIYSQFCCRMAASGKVVLAIEHRDGTGPVCMPRSWTSEGKSLSRTLLYLRETDIQYGTCI